MSVVYLAQRRPVAPDQVETIPRPLGAKVDEEKLAQLVAALHEKDEVVLSGVAGSGKTTLIRWLTPTYLIAPTGKAAQRLAAACSMLRPEDQGVPEEHRKLREAHTVHSTVYSQPDEVWFPPDQLEPCQGKVVDGIYKPAPCKGCQCRLELRWPGKEIPLKAGMVLVVDEASMLDVEMVTAIRQRVRELGRRVHGLKILWSGDPAQLPPVNGQPGIDLQQPDVMLEHVHRTDRAGILDLSTRVRHAASADEIDRILADVARGAFEGVTPGSGQMADAAAWRVATDNPDSRMLITWTNQDRVGLNRFVRRALRRETPLQRGDRVLVRTNNRMAGLLNGEILTVTAAEPHEKSETVRIHAKHGGAEKRFVVMPKLLETADRDAFFRERAHCSPPWGDPIVNVQYGYVLTCHAAQGSQAPHVGVIWTSANTWMARKNLAGARSWLYTAVTRAESSLTIWQVSR